MPWRRKWQATPVFLPGEYHGLRSLAGYSPWGHRVGHDWETEIQQSSQNTSWKGASSMWEFGKHCIRESNSTNSCGVMWIPYWGALRSLQLWAELCSPAVMLAAGWGWHSDVASVFQEPGQLRAPHWGGGHDGDGPQAGPHVRLHLRPVSVQPPAPLWVKPLGAGEPGPREDSEAAGVPESGGPLEQSCILVWERCLCRVTAPPHLPGCITDEKYHWTALRLITAKGSEEKEVLLEREREIGAK